MESFEGASFDFEHFKQLRNYKERNAYAKQSGLVLLGHGMARTAYALTPTKVLKIASDAQQSSMEFSAFETFGKDFCPVIYDHDPHFAWMIVERAQTWPTNEDFTGSTGLTENWLIHFGDFLKNYNSPKDPAQAFQEFEKKKKPIEADEVRPTKRGKDLIRKFVYLTKAGMDDIDRFDHWGITPDNRLVCIDLGMTHGD